MECHNVQKSLADYDTGAVHEDIKKQMDAHLNTCDTCRTELLFLHKTSSAIHDLQEIETPDWLWQKIEGKLFEEKKPWWQVSLFRPVAALAFALLLFVVSYWKLNQPSPRLPVAVTLKTVDVTENTFHAAPFVEQYYATEAANPVSQNVYLAVMNEGEN